MSSIGRMSLLEAVDLHLRRWKRSYDSRRKIVLLTLFTLFLVMYCGPALLRWIFSSNSSHDLINLEKTALEEHLRPFLIEEQSFNTFISRSWFKTDYDIDMNVNVGSSQMSNRPSTSSLSDGLIFHKHFHSFIGNGKFGIDIPSPSLPQEKSGIWIKGRRGLDVEVPFHPVVKVDPIQNRKESVCVLRIREGLVHRITTFPYVATTAVVYETMYVHRLISSLFVQEIRISNPSMVPLVLRLSRQGWKGKPAIKTTSLVVIHGREEKEYVVTEGDVKSMEGHLVNGFVISAPVIQDSIEVPAKGKYHLVLRTFVNYTTPTPPGRISLVMSELKNSIQETTKKVDEMLSTSLLQYHSQAWNNLWKTGFGISHSKAGEGVVNGDDINATIYYILSHKASFASDFNLIVPTETNFDIRTNFLLNHPDRCYAGNPTLQAPNLWAPLSDAESVQKIVRLWLLTLEKNGCGNLLSAGAEGTMQAVILSFVAMQFHQNHLEMGIHPKELHRDYFLRRVRYSNTTSLNVTMIVGEDYKASIRVILDKNTGSRDFYACDAGCLDSPVKLSGEEETQFPVKITEPLTAILYVTNDRQHVVELKHAIHVKEVAVAPAHETHIIALHRHGHQLGGLPAFFWASIFILVVLFHIFLAKLIYNEYCGGGSEGLRSSYSSGSLLSSSSSNSFPGVSYDKLRRAV